MTSEHPFVVPATICSNSSAASTQPFSSCGRRGARIGSTRLQVSRKRTGRFSPRMCATASAMLAMASGAPLPALREGEQFEAVLVLDRELLGDLRSPILNLNQPSVERRGGQRPALPVGRDNE